MRKSYGQNREDIIIQDYFNSITFDRQPVLLDIGANDGMTLSNSRLLLESGIWKGYLIEPSKEAFRRLTANCVGVNSVCLEVAVGVKNSTVDFMESGVHFPNGTDVALVSTINEEDYNKWKNTTNWKKYKVRVVDFNTLLREMNQKYFDFISIDIEGMDLPVLEQMDLTALGVKCLCVEHNSKNTQRYIDHCAKHGLVEIARNYENLIFVKR
jgi:FkbM family methyltransferase